MQVRFIDTSLRDGSQSLWASGLRTGMIEAIGQAMDRAGFDAIEVPITPNVAKKLVRDLKEDPWERARIVARTMPHTVKGCMGGAFLLPFGAPPPRSMIRLWYARMARIGALDRLQMICNTQDQIRNAFPWIVPVCRELGIQVAVALAYTISPRHTDEYYAGKTREALAFEPDAIYLKDQGGLLTVDRVRTLVPAILASAGSVPVELHSHCTTGMADLVYLEALRFGVRRLHTAVPPLANGSSQPSIFNVARNARLTGYSPAVEEALLHPVSERLTAIAKQEKLAIGAPPEYDFAQYVHQVPGGVISNLMHQLAELRIQHRADQVLEESVQVRKDFGYPIMITPHSQFVVTQAAINVACGERYRHVIDELIGFAQGMYGEDSGYGSMDQDLKDRLLGLPRARELREVAARQRTDITMEEIRESLGASGVSDEEFLLRYIMKGEREIEAMRAAGPPKRYLTAAVPLVSLLRELENRKRVRYVHIRRGSDSLRMQKGAAV